MDKKIVALIIAIVVIAIIVVVNPFKQPELPSDGEEPLVDDVGPGPLDVLAPEELEAHDWQIKQSDPVRFEALQKKDPSVCEQEAKPEDIDWCKAAVAERLKDEGICPALSNFARNQCYADVAFAKLDLELCNNVADSDNKDYCIERVAAYTQNLEACYLVQNTAMGDDCIAWIAMDKNDSSICERVRDAEFKEDCKMNITD